MPSTGSLPPLFDTHAHLDEPSLLADQSAILGTAAEAGLVGILTIGTTVDSSRKSIELCETHEMLHAAVGIHPNYVAQATDSDWDQIVELAARPTVVAIGETGLDKYWKHTPLDDQVDYFERHLELTRQTGKPFIVHCRDAEAETLEVLGKAAEHGPLNGVMHSFCGDTAMAQQCVEWGMMISFSGMLTFKRNEELRSLAAGLPTDRVLVETDSPYLAPMPFRGKRNQPGYVKHTAEVLGDCLGLSYEQICDLSTANARRFLGLE